VWQFEGDGIASDLTHAQSLPRILRGSPIGPVVGLRCNLSDERKTPGFFSPDHGVPSDPMLRGLTYPTPAHGALVKPW